VTHYKRDTGHKYLKKKIQNFKKFKKNKKFKDSKKRGADTWHLLNGVVLY